MGLTDGRRNALGQQLLLERLHALLGTAQVSSVLGLVVERLVVVLKQLGGVLERLAKRLQRCCAGIPALPNMCTALV